MNREKALRIFDIYINGNISEFKQQIRKLNKANLLKCIDYLVTVYGYKYKITEHDTERDMLRTFLYHLTVN